MAGGGWRCHRSCRRSSCRGPDAPTVDRMICCSTPPLVLNDAGTADVVIFVNDTGALLSTLPMGCGPPWQATTINRTEDATTCRG